MDAPPDSLFEDYIGTLYERLDFAAHHRLHAADAHLVVGGRVARKRDLPEDGYARFMADLVRPARWDAGALRQREPYFSAPHLIDVVCGADGAQVCFVELREPRHGAPLIAAFGTLREAGHAAISWVTLADAERDPGRLRTRAMSELAFVPEVKGRSTLFFSMLEVSYFRKHMLPRDELFFLPEARFSCHMSGRCCRSHMAIRLSENDAAALEARNLQAERGALRGIRLLTRVPPQDPRFDRQRPLLMAHGENGACPFLDRSGLCMVHEDAGMAVFYDCHTFPYGFTFTPDGVAVWTHLFCPSARARRGSSFAENKEDIRARLQRIPRSIPTTFYRDEACTVPWSAFRTAEEVLLAALGAEAHPVRARLLAALRFLEGWVDEAPPPFDGALLRAELLPPMRSERELAAQVLNLFSGVSHFCPLRLSDEARLTPRAGAFLDEELGSMPLLPYLLRTLVFSKTFSYSTGLIPGFNLVVVGYCLMIRRFAGWRSEAIPETAWEDFMSGLQNAAFHQMLSALCRDPTFKGLLQLPIFGEMMLRASVFRE